MVDIELIYNHSKLATEIIELENEDDKRKTLIKLAVLRAIMLLKGSSHGDHETNQINELMKKINDYEFSINKLKQEHSTKEKLQNSKLEAMKEEILNLKQQLKEYPNSTFAPPLSSIFKPSINSGTLRPPSDTYSSIALNSKFKLGSRNGDFKRSYMSPTFNSINKSVQVQDNSVILTPLQKRKILIPTKSKKEYTNYNTLKRKFENEQLQASFTNPPLNENENLQVTTPTRPRPLRKSSRIGTLTKSSASTPISDRSLNIDSSSNVLPKETSLASNTDDEAFTSANSSLSSQKLDKSDKKKKKLKLWKSEASKLPSADFKTNDIIDEEIMNSLDYYKDSNFINDKSSPKIFKKRAIDDVTPAPSNVKRKKKNVFRIE